MFHWVWDLGFCKYGPHLSNNGTLRMLRMISLRYVYFLILWCYNEKFIINMFGVNRSKGCIARASQDKYEYYILLRASLIGKWVWFYSCESYRQRINMRMDHLNSTWYSFVFPCTDSESNEMSHHSRCLSSSIAGWPDSLSCGHDTRPNRWRCPTARKSARHLVSLNIHHETQKKKQHNEKGKSFVQMGCRFHTICAKEIMSTQWGITLMCTTVHIRSYNVKSHWKGQGCNSTPE